MIARPIYTSRGRPARLVIIWSMIVSVALSGVAFAYKVAEFIFAISNEAFAGSFDVPVIVYFTIAAGWLAMLIWCVTAGKFKEMERSKYEMLAQEEEYDKLGI